MNELLPLLTNDELRPLSGETDEAGFGALETPRGLLPLRGLHVSARIEGLFAETSVRQTFVNPYPEPLEATYIFPLPDRAGVTGFRLEVAGRVVEGELKERGQARRDYAQAMRRGHRAAISEEERPNVFTLRVGNLPPHESATVHLTLSGPLPYADGEATYRFPLVVAPRYVPGAPLPGGPVGEGTAADTDAVPDASRISPPVLLPGHPNPVRLSLEAEIHPGGGSLGPVRSSLHAVVADRLADGALRVRIQPGERLDRDFVLRIRFGAETLLPALVVRPDPQGNEGTFALTLLPPLAAATAERPRDVVFVLDRSGSMEGWKMVAARRAVVRMIDTLTDRDRFTVLAFDNRTTVPPAGGGKLVAATAHNRFRVGQFVNDVRADGGTEMAEPLNRAVNLLSEHASDRDRILVLITDGQVGNEDQILRMLHGRLQHLRVFTLGIDRAVNEGFLRRLALAGGGFVEVVESEDWLDAVTERLHRRIGMPVLRDLRVEPAGLAADAASQVPARLPDLFPGTPLVLFGRYRGASAGSLRVTATDAAGQPWTATVPATRGSSSAITSAWARGRVRELEDRYASGGDRAGLEKEITETSLRFGVLSRFTAYVAVDVREVVNEGGAVRRVTQPVETPEGWAEAEPAAGGGRGGFGGGGAARPAAPAPGAALPKRRFTPEETVRMRSGSTVDEELRRPPQNPPPRAPEELAEEDFDDDTDGDTTTDYDPLAHRAASPRTGAGGKRRTKRAGKGEAPGPDLTAYRRRSADLLERLRTAPADDAGLRHALGVLAVQLEALLEDLRSVHAVAADVQPLADLLAELRQLRDPRTSAVVDASALRSKAEGVLRAFAGVSATPPASEARTGEFRK